MIRVFPVAGDHQVVDTYGQPRPNGRTHQGQDIVAARGTPVVAVDDGRAERGEDPLGGHVVRLYTSDGVKYYYAHLEDARPASGAVRAGDVLGYVGTSGNAPRNLPHLHFGAYRAGDVAFNPYRELVAATVVAPPSPATSSSSGSSRAAAVLVVLALVAGVAVRGAR
jgi:murein DD-endopeptidase MepM/ murein hydrolase activator NlpD